MEALKKKWNSCQGASILLALLFLLVCMMVGTSVLMAADSNMGKIRSNKEEEQRYFTLSSAMTLLCDELRSVEYVGKYKYTWENKSYTVGTPPDEITIVYTEHTFTQRKSEVRVVDRILREPWGLNKTLPLYNDLDAVFVKEFEQEDYTDPITGDVYIFKTSQEAGGEAVPDPSLKNPYTLELELDSGDYGDLSEPVSITVKLDTESGNIILSAFLKEHPDYKMEAALTCNDLPKNLLVINTTTPYPDNETEPLTWTLVSIAKTGLDKDGTGGGSDESSSEDFP